MGAAVSVDAGFAGGPASIISDIEARRLLGGAMWPLYADEFNSLPQVREIKIKIEDQHG